jgi:carbon monoxide dehydrogenase subunit G
MVRISHTFEVARPVEDVWTFFQDIPSVSQCLPGAELTEDKGEGVYAGKVSVKLGPLSATFEGEATVSPDDVSRVGTIEGKGVDRRGGSRGQVKVAYTVSQSDAGTQVDIDADVTLSGAAAQFGRTGLINEMSSRLIGEFVTCVEGKLAAGSVEEARQVTAGEVKGFSLFIQSLLAWIRRLFSRS